MSGRSPGLGPRSSITISSIRLATSRWKSDPDNGQRVVDLTIPSPRLHFETKDPKEINEIVRLVPQTTWASPFTKNSHESCELYEMTIVRRTGETRILFTETEFGISGRTPNGLLYLIRRKFENAASRQHK